MRSLIGSSFTLYRYVNSRSIIKTHFIRHENTELCDYFQLKHQKVHEHDLDITDTHANSIIKDSFLEHKMNIVSYAVKTIENTSTCCGHERCTVNDNAKLR